MSTSQAPFVFVSYAHADEVAMKRLVADLRVRGITAWIDKSGIPPGTPDWENSLRSAISRADAVLLIASPEARNSRYVKDELRIAEAYKRRIYPVWVAGTQWIDSIPIGYGGMQYVDARGAYYEQALRSLVAALNGVQPLTIEVPNEF